MGDRRCRLSGLILPLFAWLSLSACGALQSQPPPAKWTTGFWYWHEGSVEPAPAKVIPDVLYFHAGTIWKYRQWQVSQELPDSLPPAREYWLVFREEQQNMPDVSAAPYIAERASRLLAEARQRHLKVVGIQLDIDCPTSRLAGYAALLREVRKDMPAGLGISITALLDWFRDGTSVADVIEETDEFVPQFYDLAPAPNGSGDWRAIAAKIDAGHWGPKFNTFGKRFRIGISTFGRARFEPRFFADLTPLDIAANPAFTLRTSHSEANELILTYGASRKARLGYNDFQPGDTIQFVLPTPESIRAAVESARRMRGNCAGIVFFRWPASYENLVMWPDEVLTAAGLAPPREKAVGVESVDGHCAAVSCVDLYLVNAAERSPGSIGYRIHSSVELEYFLPQERVPVRLVGASDLDLTLPPWCGRSRLSLGRAVTATPAEFHAEERP
ncbi:MAG: DUF3142 domain-containing protein [Bryobacteraceae bacterium]